MSAIEYQEQIEDTLGRPLAPAELLPARTLDELTDAQVAVVESLAPRHVILPLHYLRAVAPGVPLNEIREYSDRVARRVRDSATESGSTPRGPDNLANAALFERYLGRTLATPEKVRVSGIKDLSPAHLAVASALLHAEQAVGFMYLHRVAPTSSTEERSELAAKLMVNEA